VKEIDSHSPRAEVIRIRLLELDVGCAPLEFTREVARKAIEDAQVEGVMCARVNGKGLRFCDYWAAVFGVPWDAKRKRA